MGRGVGQKIKAGGGVRMRRHISMRSGLSGRRGKIDADKIHKRGIRRICFAHETG